MKTQNLIIAFIAILFFTSCEQDNSFLQDAAATTKIQQTTPEGSEERQEPLEKIEKFTKKQTKAEITRMDSTRTTFKFERAVELEVKQESQVESRSETIQCDVSFEGTTYNQRNKITSELYRAMGLNARLDGGDELFYFTLDKAQLVSFDLTNTTTNMAMILFKGTRNCSSYSCSYRLNELMARTASSSNFGDEIQEVELEAGTYILVVDAPYGRASNFTLSMTCGYRLGDPLFFYTEDFNSYQNGNISSQSDAWSKWNSRAFHDASVVGNNNKYLFLEGNPYMLAEDQADVLYQLTPASNGTYHIKFDLWVADNRSAYFNIQKQLSFNNTNNEFGAQVFFYNNRTGAVKIADRTYNFTYHQNRWIEIYLDIHTDINDDFGASISVNDQPIAQFNPRWSSNTSYGSDKIAAIDFYASASDAKFWVDNIEVNNEH